MEYPMLPSSADVGTIYRATDGACGARKLMVDLHVWKTAGPWVKQHIETGLKCPSIFDSDLEITLLSRKFDVSRMAKMGKEVSEYFDRL